MVSDPSLLEGIDVEGIESGKVFAREERKQIVEVVEWDVVAADEAYLGAPFRNWDFRSPEWKATFPSGFPLIVIGLRGVDVKFAFSPDEILRIYVPMRNELGHNNAGKTKGRGSQLQIVNDAFKQVYGVSVLPSEQNKPAVLEAGPTLWGQHLGEFQEQGSSEKREWGWDIPRQKLGKDFKYAGEVRVIQGRNPAGAAGAAAGAVGTAQLSEDDSNAAVARALDGLEIGDFKAHEAAVLNIPGLGASWYDIATDPDGNVAQEANERGLIVAGSDGLIHLAGQSEDETEAPAPEPVATGKGK